MLPQQKLAMSQKGPKWREESIRYFENLSYTNYSGNRATNYRKLINYDLYNGRFNRADLEYVCEPMGITSANRQFPAQLQHYDIISPAINTLIGEEMARPDNAIIIAENPEAISRKKDQVKKNILGLLQNLLMAEIDPSTVDPKNPPKFEELEKYKNYNFQDMVESQASRILKHLKRKLGTRGLFLRGWKDALIAGEEIYWTGIVNGEPQSRRTNPCNVNCILANDSEFVDDSLAVIEVRLMTIPQVLDELGDDLTTKQISDLEKQAKDPANRFPIKNGIDLSSDGVDNTSNYAINASQVIQNNQNSMSIRVVRVEWISMKKVGCYKFKDEQGQEQEKLVDEIFKLSPQDIEAENTVEWFWINEAWEGTKIGLDMYINIQPKANQRRRLDNPYYTRLGYQGLIYNSTNSISVSLIDRLKPYQYLYNILMYRLELAFASDFGKIMIMDLAQIPRSEGIDVEQWMYYLKAMKIGFINSFEEGKGKFTGQKSTFNQFQSVDMSLSNTIQQYVNSLNFIKSQVLYLSGVDQTRMGQIAPEAGLGTSQMNLQQSANVTRPWVEGHNAVKERVYTALIECAKIAYRKGKEIQYVNDDLSIDMLSVEGPDIENSEFSVFVSNSARDSASLDELKKLFKSALQADKANFSDIANILRSDSMSDITKLLEKNEADKADRDSQAQQAEQQHEKELQQQAEADKEKDRQLKQYVTDQSNATKIQVAEIENYFKSAGEDDNSNGIPDPMEIADHALAKQELQSKVQMEHQKLEHEKTKHKETVDLKKKELVQEKELELKRLKAEEQRTKSEKDAAEKEIKLKKQELEIKETIERLKIKASKNKPKG